VQRQPNIYTPIHSNSGALLAESLEDLFSYPPWHCITWVSCSNCDAVADEKRRCVRRPVILDEDEGCTWSLPTEGHQSHIYDSTVCPVFFSDSISLRNDFSHFSSATCDSRHVRLPKTSDVVSCHLSRVHDIRMSDFDEQPSV